MNLNNMRMLRFSLRELAGGAEVLYGEGRGRRVCEALVAQTPPDKEELRIAIDFEGVDHASASFIREAVLGYAGYLRGLGQSAFPFVANMNEETEEELQLVLNARGECIVSVALSAKGNISSVKVLGLSDGQHSKTLELLLNGIELSVSEVRAKLPEGGKPAGTALNGRLEWLSSRGLLSSRQYGREKRYRFPFGGGC